MVTKIYVAEGSSTTAGADVGGPNFSYSGLYAADHPEITWHNPPGGGENINDIVARAATIDGFLVFPAVNVLSIQPLGNVSGSGLAADIVTLATYLDARRSAGWYMVLQTLPGWYVRTPDDNPTLRSWVGLHCDAIADIGADPTIGEGSGAGSNPTYFTGHPTELSQTIMLGIMAPVLDARFSSLKQRRILKVGT